MGCSPKAIERMMRNRREHPGSAEYWGDKILDALTLATEWDADQWGLDPDGWMATERAEMAQRGGSIPQR